MLVKQPVPFDSENQSCFFFQVHPKVWAVGGGCLHSACCEPIWLIYLLGQVSAWKTPEY